MMRPQKLKTRVKTAVARWKSYCIAEHSHKFCCPISAMATFSCEKNILEPSVNQKTNQKKNSGTADSKHSLFNSLVNTYYRFTQQYIWLHDFFFKIGKIFLKANVDTLCWIKHFCWRTSPWDHGWYVFFLNIGLCEFLCMW